jgi:hypothetical protein
MEKNSNTQETPQQLEHNVSEWFVFDYTVNDEKRKELSKKLSEANYEDVEVKFSTGETRMYNDDDWPLQEITHCRFKTIR